MILGHWVNALERSIQTVQRSRAWPGNAPLGRLSFSYKLPVPKQLLLCNILPLCLTLIPIIFPHTSQFSKLGLQGWG